ncbi:hypothetical protein niasHT_030722 [Heterodera trifolii]|uniref:Uncharacterized protein n=1 Tax=Heterodera trifolii TaxID=157864 RepID=A0ABD2HQN8_9BILA
MAFRCRRRGKLCVFVRIGAVFVRVHLHRHSSKVYLGGNGRQHLAGEGDLVLGRMGDYRIGRGAGETIAQWIRWGPSGLRKEGMTTPSQHSGGPGAGGWGRGGHVFEPSKRTTEKGKGEENTVDEKGEERGEGKNTMQKTRWRQNFHHFLCLINWENEKMRRTMGSIVRFFV